MRVEAPEKIREVLCTALNDEQAANVLVSKLKPGVITDPRYSVVYELLRDGVRTRNEMNTALLDREVPQRQQLIQDLLGDGGNPDHIDWDINELNKRWVVREAKSAFNSGSDGIDKAVDSVEALEVISGQIAKLQALFAEIEDSPATKEDELLEIVADIDNRNDGKPENLIQTFRSIDEQIGGLSPGDLMIVGAETSGGKTAFAVSLANEILKAGKSCVYFSAEMSSRQIIERFLCVSSSIPLQLMRKGTPNNTQRPLIAEGAKRLHEYKLEAVCVAGWHIDQISAKASALKGQDKADFIVVDYLQLIGGKGDIREQEVASVSRRLKTLANEIGSPILALSQLNENGKIRESRAIAHDADFVIMLSPEYNEVTIDKNRHGPRGETVELEWVGRFTRWQSPA